MLSESRSTGQVAYRIVNGPMPAGACGGVNVMLEP